jgi:hypothetical protein
MLKLPETLTQNHCEPSDQSPSHVDRPIEIQFYHMAATYQMEASGNTIEKSELDTWHMV